jgi:protein ImuA
MTSTARSERLQALIAEVQAIAPVCRADVPSLPFGIAALDSKLASGGLASAALHEIAGETASLGDDAAATLFVAGIAARASQGDVLWIMDRPDLFAPGLAGAGIPASRLIQVEAGKDADALAVMEEALRHGALSAVVCEVARIGMTATRRLQLAAEEGGTMALVLRRWRRAAEDPLAQPSSALTRWRIACAPSEPLPVPGVGRARWQVSLVRQRGGDPQSWLLEGCDATGRLAVPAEPRRRSATPRRREVRQAA